MADELSPPSESKPDPGPPEIKASTEMGKQRLIGEILIDEGFIKPEDLSRALQMQKRRLGEILVDLGVLKTDDLDSAIKLQEMGKTKAQIYGRYLRIAMAVILVLALVSSATLLRLKNTSQFLLRMEEERLTVAEVREVLKDESSPYKFEALRSLNRHLKEPEGITLIREALESEIWYVKLYAIYLTRKSKNQQFVKNLIPLLIEPHEYVRPMAHEALVEITGQTFGPSLKTWKEWAEKTLP